MLTQEEIRAADFILKHTTMNPSSGVSSYRYGELEVSTHIGRVAKYLQEEGLIRLTEHAGPTIYTLTVKGDEFKRSGKSYSEYLKEKEAKLARQSKKDKNDEKRTTLQIKELEIKLKSLEVMQDEQRKFWQSGLDRDRRQKWQFWWTWVVSGAALIISALAFIKSVIIG